MINIAFFVALCWIGLTLIFGLIGVMVGEPISIETLKSSVKMSTCFAAYVGIAFGLFSLGLWVLGK